MSNLGKSATTGKAGGLNESITRDISLFLAYVKETDKETAILRELVKEL